MIELEKASLTESHGKVLEMLPHLKTEKKWKKIWKNFEIFFS